MPAAEAAEVARLRLEVAELRDAAAEADAQGGVRAVAELSGVCSALQLELAGLEHRHAALMKRLARAHACGLQAAAGSRGLLLGDGGGTESALDIGDAKAKSAQRARLL